MLFFNKRSIAVLLPFFLTAFLLTIAHTALAHALNGSTYTVCAFGCDFSSIQQAVDSAQSGDTLELAGETFTEPITLNKSLTLEGNGAGSTILQAAPEPSIASTRVITVTEGVTVTIRGVTIRHGSTTWEGGGGLHNNGAATLENSRIYSNTAFLGGGIFNTGAMTVTNCTVDNNYAKEQGGGIYIYNTIEMIIQDSMFSENIAVRPDTWGLDWGGGGLFAKGSTSLIYNTSFINNTARGYRSQGGGLVLESDSVTTIYNSFIAGNSAYKGGGIYSKVDNHLVVTETIVIDNAAVRGGGIYNEIESTIDIVSSTLSNNTAENLGGGILNIDGGIANLSNTLIYSNSAVTGRGGGIYNKDYPSVVNIANSTLSHNSAGEFGGGIDSAYNGQVYAINTTFDGNFTGGTGSDIASHRNSRVHIWSSILSGETAQVNCYHETGTYEAYVFDNGYNIIEDGSCLTDPTSFAADPRLAPLQDNGGESMTHALMEGSPAIDAVPIDECMVKEDQRGVPRPVGEACDIGAFEVEAQLLSRDIFLPLVVSR